MKRAMAKIFVTCFGIVLLSSIPVRADWYMKGTKWRYSYKGADLSSTWIHDDDYIFYELGDTGNYTGNKKEFITNTDGLDIDLLRAAHHSYKDLAGKDKENLYYALSLINAERAKVGVAPLELSAERSILGSYINENMYKKSYFDHHHSNANVAEYVLSFKKMFPDFNGKQGENLYYSAIMGAPLAPIKDLVAEAESWYVNSPTHYKNIIDPDYKKVGIGFTIKKEGNKEVFYYSQEFSE